MASRLQEGSTSTMGALTGAAGGAAIGSALGPPGSATGAVVGAAIGGGIGLTAGLADVFSAREAEDAIKRQQRQLRRALGDYELSSLELARGAALGVGQQAEASAAKVGQAAAASGMDPAVAQQLAEQTRADVAAAGSQQIAQAVRAGADIEAARRQSVMQEAGFSQQLASAERGNVSDWVGQVAGLSAGAVDLAGSLGAISRDRAELNKTQEPSADLTKDRDDQSQFVSMDNATDVNDRSIYSGETREPPAMSTPGMPAPGAPAPGAPAPAPVPATVPRRPNTPAPAGGQPASPAQPQPAPAPQPAQGQRRQKGGERISEPPYGIATPPPPEVGIRPSGLGGFAANVSAGAYAPPQTEKQARAVEAVKAAEQQLQAAVQQADVAYSDPDEIEDPQVESEQPAILPGDYQESQTSGTESQYPAEVVNEVLDRFPLVGRTTPTIGVRAAQVLTSIPNVGHMEAAALWASTQASDGEDIKQLADKLKQGGVSDGFTDPTTFYKVVTNGLDDNGKMADLMLAMAETDGKVSTELADAWFDHSAKMGKFETAPGAIRKVLRAADVVGATDRFIEAHGEYLDVLVDKAPRLSTAPSLTDIDNGYIVFDSKTMSGRTIPYEAAVIEKMSGLRVVTTEEYMKIMGVE